MLALTRSFLELIDTAMVRCQDARFGYLILKAVMPAQPSSFSVAEAQLGLAEPRELSQK